MECGKIVSTLQAITALIHSAGVARNVIKAKEFFDEISRRNLQADIGDYNALMSAFIRSRDVKSAAVLMNEMEEKHVGLDNVTYHTMFLGLIRSEGIDVVSEHYHLMILKNFVPKARTVVILMKLFCENQKIDLVLNLWSCSLEKGHCPHSHALDILMTRLYSKGRSEEAFDCARQTLERGRHMSDPCRMLERHLLQIGEMDKLQRLEKLIKRLHATLPVPENT
ncbi:hypothetical protein ACH5RR_034296 [Cinchona calisaya]|uniref:Pentatricopeptide repeat-containing protein n=1 Tax=Cinchona calisaya TaxID=153742 RepID=A0ABD2YB87_9GENT